VDTTGASVSGPCTNSGSDITTFFDSFTDDEALVGRDLGDDSPEAVSRPKNDHFFADRGVEGEGRPAARVSDSRGREPRRFGAGGLGEIDCSRSRIGSAVRGLVSLSLLPGVKLRFSFGGGEDVPDMMDDIEFDTE